MLLMTGEPAAGSLQCSADISAPKEDASFKHAGRDWSFYLNLEDFGPGIRFGTSPDYPGRQFLVIDEPDESA